MPTAQNADNILLIEVVLGPDAGTWRMTPKGHFGNRQPCYGREFPVFITSKTPSNLDIKVHGDSVLLGCFNQNAALKLIDPDTLEGTLHDGRALKLKRAK